tara:strand:+ start:2051 stop:2470 length:420 start_codon:yes stop_codon:yes gene_type:complete
MTENIIYYDRVEHDRVKMRGETYISLTTITNNVQTETFAFTDDWLDPWPYSGIPEEQGLIYWRRPGLINFEDDVWYQDEKHKCLRRWTYPLTHMSHLITIQNYLWYYYQQKRYIQSVVSLSPKLPAHVIYEILDYCDPF